MHKSELITLCKISFSATRHEGGNFVKPRRSFFAIANVHCTEFFLIVNQYVLRPEPPVDFAQLMLLRHPYMDVRYCRYKLQYDVATR